MMLKLLVIPILVAMATAQEVDIDEFVAEVMRCANIPGLTLAVVRNGENWITKGYGVRDIDTQEPVTEDTVFLLASTTKAFTGVTLAIILKDLEDTSFQTPVRDILGDWFYLYDGTRSAQVQLRDVIAHRTGLPGHNDMRLAGWNLTEFVERLQYLEYTYDFRDRYRYNNIMYSIAALVSETLDGKPYTEIVQSEIFDPLGMSTSTFVTNRNRWPDFPTAYYEENNGDLRSVSLEVPEAYFTVTPTSGGIGSSATDMRQWIKFQLNRGETEDGTVILPSSEFAETHRALIQRTANPDFQRPEDPVTFAPPSRYSLGWQETTYRDYELHIHTGSSSGYHSMVAILPDMDHGLFIGLNKSPDNYARDVIAMYLLDTMLGIGPWLSEETVCDIMNSKYEATLVKKEETQTAKVVHHRNQNTTHQKPKVRVEEYVGVYGNFAYGTIAVELGSGSSDLVLRYGRDDITWDLMQDQQDPDRFSGNGREPFWFYNLDVQFEREGSNPAEAVTLLSFDDELPPRFERDLDLTNPPPPPVPCV